MACHLGVLTGLPCIGVAKNLLQVDGLAKDELHKEQVRPAQASLPPCQCGEWSKSLGEWELLATPLLASPATGSWGATCWLARGSSRFLRPSLSQQEILAALWALHAGVK